MGDWVVPNTKLPPHPRVMMTANPDPFRNTRRVRRRKTNRAEERRALAEAQNWRCCYCNVECDRDDDRHWKGHSSTIEHVVELCRGGSDEWENLVMACFGCNDERGNKMSAEEFYRRKAGVV